MSYDPGTEVLKTPSGTPLKPRLLDEVRRHLRAKRDSLRTEATYVAWVRRFILANGKRHPRAMGGPKGGFCRTWPRRGMSGEYLHCQYNRLYSRFEDEGKKGPQRVVETSFQTFNTPPLQVRAGQWGASTLWRSLPAIRAYRHFFARSVPKKRFFQALQNAQHGKSGGMIGGIFPNHRHCVLAVASFQAIV